MKMQDQNSLVRKDGHPIRESGRRNFSNLSYFRVGCVGNHRGCVGNRGGVWVTEGGVWVTEGCVWVTKGVCFYPYPYIIITS